MKVITSLVSFLHLLGNVAAAEYTIVDAECLVRDAAFAGERTGTLVDDMTQLTNEFSLESRLYGFQFCTDTGSGILTTLRLKLAYDYGRSDDFIDLSPLGPGTTNCQRLELSDPVNAPIESIEFFTFGGSVTGFKIQTATRSGSVGNVSVTDSVTFTFERVAPLAGLFGFSGDRFIDGIGVIRYDIACQAQKEQEKQNNGGGSSTDPDLDKEDGESEDDDNTGALIGIIVGIVAVIILTVVIVYFVLRIRRQSKRLN